MSLPREYSEEFKKKFGNRLRELRKSKGYSIEQAVNALNVPRPTYTHWELGNRVPQAKPLSDIAALFNTHESYLLLRTDEPTPITGDLDDIFANVKQITYKDKPLTNDQIQALTGILESWNNQMNSK